eukprot:1688278-Rhodomonas_salina.1
MSAVYDTLCGVAENVYMKELMVAFCCLRCAALGSNTVRTERRLREATAAQKADFKVTPSPRHPQPEPVLPGTRCRNATRPETEACDVICEAADRNLGTDRTNQPLVYNGLARNWMVCGTRRELALVLGK